MSKGARPVDGAPHALDGFSEDFSEPCRASQSWTGTGLAVSYCTWPSNPSLSVLRAFPPLAFDHIIFVSHQALGP
jgi:hypothetical protein